VFIGLGESPGGGGNCSTPGTAGNDGAAGGAWTGSLKLEPGENEPEDAELPAGRVPATGAGPPVGVDARGELDCGVAA
jgi:hypothetical protein